MGAKIPEKLREALEEAVYYCGRCALCHPVCLVYQTLKHEGFSPRGRVQLARALLEGELKPSRALFERLQACLDCKRCIEACPSGVEVDEIVLAARGKVEGFLPLTIRAAVLMLSSPAWLAGLGLPAASFLFRKLGLDDPNSPLRKLAFFAPPRYLPAPAPRPFQSEAPEVAQPAGNPKARVLLFPGCAFSRLMPQVATAAMEALLRAGFEVVNPRDLRCCGAPAEHMGMHEVVEVLVEHNRRIFRRWAPDIVTTPCASCGLTLRRHFEGEPYEVLDLSELLVREGFEAPGGELPLKVTYHDPCHLARGQGVRDQPREILRSIPGLDFVEMEEPDRCCGGAGLFFALFPDLSIEIGRFKAEAAKAVGAEVLATWCPSCMMQLSDIVRRTGTKIAVRHVLELLSASYAIYDGLSEPEEEAARLRGW